VHDRFTYYIMFKPQTDKPQDAIWVPVAKAKWSWNATAVHGDVKWSLGKSPEMKPDIDMKTVEFPLYQSNACENEWQQISSAISREQYSGMGDELEQTAEFDQFGEVSESEGYPGPLMETLIPEETSGQELEYQTDNAVYEDREDAVDPFPRQGYVLGLEMTNQAFINCASVVESDPDTSPMCGAVADLTGDPELPAFYANNPLDMVYVGSLAKVYALYVAFELRRRVQQQAKEMIKIGISTAAPGWEREVFAALAKAWKPKLKAAFPRLPEDMPKFADIFVLSPTGEAAFSQNNPPLTDSELDSWPPNSDPKKPPVSPEYKKPPGKFFDWMRLMLRWSNNEAASKCIRALSYPYINSVLGATGFFDQKTKVGLWLSGDYLGNDWLRANAAGQPLSPRWARLQGRSVSNFAGTSFQVARLMVFIARNPEMVGLMTAASLPRSSHAGIGSYIRDGLEGATPPRAFTSIASKIGCGDEVPPPACGFSHDCAIVRIDRGADPAKTVRYAVVALGGHPDRARADLHKMVVRFHDCVVARHP
jgi:hypothetical protein